MEPLEIAEETHSFTETRANLSAIVNEVYKTGKRVVIEKNGIPVAAIVPPKDIEELRSRDQQRVRLSDTLMEISEAFKDEDPEEIERQALLAVAEIRGKRIPVTHS